LHYWVAADLENAYGAVVHPRLESLLGHQIPCERMVAFVMMLMAPDRREDGRASGVPRGLPQGSPLSPFLFNSYAAHFIDRPWQKRYPQWPLFRYADDILILTGSKREAREAHHALQVLVTSAAFALKGTKTRLTNLERKPLVWLGHEIHRSGDGYEVTVPERSWTELEQRLGESKAAMDEGTREDTIAGFLAYHAPAWTSQRMDDAVSRLKGILDEARTDRRPNEGTTWEAATRVRKLAAAAHRQWTDRLCEAGKLTTAAHLERQPTTRETSGTERIEHRRAENRLEEGDKVEPAHNRNRCSGRPKTHSGREQTKRYLLNGQQKTMEQATAIVPDTNDIRMACGALHRQDTDSQAGIRPDPRGPAESSFSASGLVGRWNRATKAGKPSCGPGARRRSPSARPVMSLLARGPPQMAPSARPAKAGWMCRMERTPFASMEDQFRKPDGKL